MKVTELWKYQQNHVHVTPDKRVWFCGRQVYSNYVEKDLLRWIRINHYHGPIWFHDEFYFNKTITTCFQLEGKTLKHIGVLPTSQITYETQPTIQSVN